MEASIDYLNKVHGDLLDAATRERGGGSGPSRRRGPSSGLVAATIAILALAGLVGVVAKNGGIGIGSDEASSGGGALPATEGPIDGSTGASTGATGARERLDYLGDQSGAPLPAPNDPGGQPGGEISRVIRTAEISLVIPRDAFDQRFGDAVDIAEESGGFVADSSSRERSGTLTLRVPAESFDQTLKALRDLGDIQMQAVHGQDVTAEYVDIGARLRIAKSRREVLLGLMDDATSIEQTIRVQNALDETQLRIEELQGQLRLLDDRTSLATIEVDLREEGVERESEPPSIPNALERAIDGFLSTIGVIVIGLGYLLPVIAIGLVGWFVAVRIRRRREG